MTNESREPKTKEEGLVLQENGFRHHRQKKSFGENVEEGSCALHLPE